MKITGKGASITIDGRTFTGRSISINGDQVVVDGVVQSGSLVGPISVVVNGDCEMVENSTGPVQVSGSVGQIRTSTGDVTCGEVGGDVTTSTGDVQCGNVRGSVRTSTGDIIKRGA